MVNPIIGKDYIDALDAIIEEMKNEEEDILKDEEKGIDFISGRAKYHICDPSAIELIKTVAEKINYDNKHRFFRKTPREKLYLAFDGGPGLNSYDEIRKELINLVEAAKKTI